MIKFPFVFVSHRLQHKLYKSNFLKWHIRNDKTCFFLDVSVKKLHSGNLLTGPVTLFVTYIFLDNKTKCDIVVSINIFPRCGVACP